MKQLSDAGLVPEQPRRGVLGALADYFRRDSQAVRGRRSVDVRSIFGGFSIIFPRFSTFFPCFSMNMIFHHFHLVSAFRPAFRRRFSFRRAL